MTWYAHQESDAYHMLFDYIVIENEKVVRLSEMTQLVSNWSLGLRNVSFLTYIRSDVIEMRKCKVFRDDRLS